MDPNREADELASRCVALVVYYQHVRKRHPNRVAIDAEYRAVATEAKMKGILLSIITSKVSTELRNRYEANTSNSLNREFVSGFSDEIEVGFSPVSR